MNGRSNEADSRHIDEGTVHAWLDGQLSANEAARVERHVAACGACSALVAEARGHIAAATRILNSLDGVPTRVIPQARRWSHQWQLRVAAAVLVMGLGTVVFLRGSHSPLGSARQEPSPDRPPGLAGQSAPRASVAAPPLEPPTPAPEAGKKLSATRHVAPPVPLANGPVPQASAAPAPAVVGGSRAHANRERDLATSARADSEPPKQSAPEAETDTAGMRPMAPAATRSAPAMAAMPSPTIENSLQRKVSDHVNVRGRVVDADGQAGVAAAQVVVPGTMIGQNTTDSGTFDITVPTNAKTLSIRRIGYEAENVPLTPGTTDYTIALKRDVLGLEAQVVTGAATSVSAQSTAKAAMAADGAGSSGGGLRLTLGGSRCQDQVVRVPTGAQRLGLGDSTEARLTPTVSQSLDQPGFVVRFVPDTASAPAGSWQPIGRDSALVKFQGPGAGTQTRVACGGDRP